MVVVVDSLGELQCVSGKQGLHCAFMVVEVWARVLGLSFWYCSLLISVCPVAINQ